MSTPAKFIHGPDWVQGLKLLSPECAIDTLQEIGIHNIHEELTYARTKAIEGSRMAMQNIHNLKKAPAPQEGSRLHDTFAAFEDNAFFSLTIDEDPESTVIHIGYFTEINDPNLDGDFIRIATGVEWWLPGKKDYNKEPRVRIGTLDDGGFFTGLTVTPMENEIHWALAEQLELNRRPKTLYWTTPYSDIEDIKNVRICEEGHRSSPIDEAKIDEKAKRNQET